MQHIGFEVEWLKTAFSFKTYSLFYLQLWKKSRYYCWYIFFKLQQFGLFYFTQCEACVSLQYVCTCVLEQNITPNTWEHQEHNWSWKHEHLFID